MFFINRPNSAFHGVQGVRHFPQLRGVPVTNRPWLMYHQIGIGRDCGHIAVRKCDYGSNGPGQGVNIHGFLSRVAFQHIVNCYSGKYGTAAGIDVNIQIFSPGFGQEILDCFRVLVLFLPGSPPIAYNVPVKIKVHACVRCVLKLVKLPNRGLCRVFAKSQNARCFRHILNPLS